MAATLQTRSLLAAGLSAGLAIAIAAPGRAEAQPTPDRTASLVGELVITAERRPEQLQLAPVAVSAFSADDLRAARIDGGRNLPQAVPNVTFGRSNFGGYNLAIRGVGSKFVGPSGEYGVSIHENATPIANNRLADAEFYDVERIEVLRGPQGTLYGRNATGGVVNIITAKPGRTFGGWATADVGSYDTRRFEGAINLPLNDMMAMRWAGFVLKRDGVGKNLLSGHEVDGRDLAGSRLSFRLNPSDALDLVALWEHFNEKDDRARAGKQLCIPDPGPASLGAVPVSTLNRGFLSQGCLPGSRYSPAALGAVNTSATLPGLFLPLIGLAPGGNLLAGKVQDANLHDIESTRDPIYQARSDFFQIDAKLRLSSSLRLESLTGFNDDKGYSYQDYTRAAPTGTFQPVGLAAVLFPGGVVNDLQAGPSNTLQSFDYYRTRAKDFSQEVRLWSEFGGAWNFSLGANHAESRTRTGYYVFSDGPTAFAQAQDAVAGTPNTFPIYVEQTFPPTGQGHNYYASNGRNRVSSDAAFGELYWRPTKALQVTGGLRVTRDHKESAPDLISLLATPTVAAPPPASGQIPNPAFNGGRGTVRGPELTRTDSAVTGRFNVSWRPDLPITDQTLVYASYSRGYKAGGFNAPCDTQSPGCMEAPRTFDPEYVDAVELGTKNVLAGGRLALNLTAFHYVYSDYQVASIINKSTVNQNVDAKIAGLEIESVWQATRDLRFNLSAGLLHTAIRRGEVIDPLNRTQGDPGLALVKAQDGSNCVVNRAALASLVTVQEALPGAPNVLGVTGSPAALLGACSGLYSALGLYDYAGRNVSTAQIVVDSSPQPNRIVAVGQGVPTSIAGKRLPNAPEWTLNFGAQYSWRLPNWRITLRGDYYRQGGSYARIFNTVSDFMRGYDNLNGSLTFAGSPLALEFQLYVKNLTDAQPLTNLYLSDDSSGLFTNTFTLDPRQYGLAVTKRF
jgi:outer membrane receptor protein involved in Fe transport